VAAVQPPDDERPHAVTVAQADHAPRVHQHDREAPFEGSHGLRRRVDQVQVAVAGDEVEHHLAVVGGLEHGAPLQQGVADLARVREVTVMHQREVAHVAAHGERLCVEAQARAGDGVARVRHPLAGPLVAEPGEALLGEDLGHEPHVLLEPHLAAAGDADAASLLAPVLQGEDAEVAEPRHVRRPRHAHAEHPALLARLVLA